MRTGTLGTVSNREDWIFSYDVIDQAGDDVNIAAADITVAVRAKGETSPRITKTVGDGITVVSPAFTVTILSDLMADLDPAQYEVGALVEIAGVKTQLIIGTITVLDGIVET